MILIILRGPAGSGKSEVCEGLKDRIKEHKSIDSCFLNLDQTNPEIFKSNMKEALECKYVIGEMFSGNGHTTNPEPWINRFKNKKYDIFSFILKASIDTCLQRCRNDKKKNRDKRYEERNQHEKDHNLFYKDPKFVNFDKNANTYETTIDTETQSIQEVCDIIYSTIKSNLG